MTEYEDKMPGPSPTHLEDEPQESEGDAPESYGKSCDKEQLTEDLVAGAAANLAVRGTLTFHFRDRDVSTITDGYAALRVLTNIREGNSGWEDPLHPCFSDAHNTWVTIRNHRLLGATWTPGREDDKAFSIDLEAA